MTCHIRKQTEEASTTININNNIIKAITDMAKKRLYKSVRIVTKVDMHFPKFDETTDEQIAKIIELWLVMQKKTSSLSTSEEGGNIII